MGTAKRTIAEVEARVIACVRCKDLRAYCAGVAETRKRQYAGEEYWGKPVPAFGDPSARVMLVGLAPGAHGSNRTGRMFTGDASGDFLYPALHRAGFASQPIATRSDDGMVLHDCIITSAARCAPPKNRPTPQHLANCLPFLLEEFDALPHVRVIIGLGRIGFDAAKNLLKQHRFLFSIERLPQFGHGVEYDARRGQRTITLIGTYHPSRQNTNTGVLTAKMLDAIFQRAARLRAL